MYKRIIVPVDGSPTANKALVAALQLARDSGGRVRLIHVVEELAFVDGYDMYGGQTGELLQVMREAGDKVLRRAVGRSGRQRRPRMECRPDRAGHPRPARHRPRAAGQRRRTDHPAGPDPGAGDPLRRRNHAPARLNNPVPKEHTMNDTTDSLKKSQARLAHEFNTVLDDAQDLLRHTAGEDYAEVRNRLQNSVKSARERVGSIEQAVIDSARQAGKTADGYVRSHTWESIAIGAGVGLLLGLLIARR
jgi:ElaB/YqjD/DUF883 family membrane-anchored ribosome-binding protein